MTAGSIAQTCVILAGGLGTRLRGVIGETPKCLAPVGQHTFLELHLARLADAGITNFVLSLGYGADAVIDALARIPLPALVRYVREEQPLGTGGAIRHALDALQLDEVLVANGDTWLEGDITAMLEPLDRRAGELFRMAAVKVPDRSRFGGVEADASGRVTRFLEKGRGGSGLINAGLYRLCRESLPSSREGAYSLEQDVLPALVAQGQVALQPLGGSMIDIGVPEDYRRFCERHIRGELRPAAFIDRDGVINVDLGHVCRVEDFHLLPRAVDGLRLLAANGYELIVVTNQAGIAKGLYDEAAYHLLTEHMLRVLSSQGVRITAVYHCPHHPQGVVPAYAMVCDCRKPAPAMLFRAATENRLDLARSVLIGDKASDVAAGRAADIGRTVLVASGHALPADAARLADHVSEDLSAAAQWLGRPA